MLGSVLLMKRLMLLIVSIILLSGCSNNNEQASINQSIKECEVKIEEYEAKIEEALLMTNGYQDAKYTSVREELDKFLISSRDKYDFELMSPYEGLTLDEALDYYNNLNGTELVNITKEENSRKGTSPSQSLIDSKEEGFYEADTSIGRYVWLKGIAENLASCGEICNSNLISYEDAKKWVETGEYNIEWTYIDGELVNSPALDDNEQYGTTQTDVTKNEATTIDDVTRGTCKELDGIYSIQGLKLSTCTYFKPTKSGHSGEVYVTVHNNSGSDLSYVRVEIYTLDSKGNTIASTFTNDTAIIRDGGTQLLKAYVTHGHSYEVEITDARTK